MANKRALFFADKEALSDYEERIKRYRETARKNLDIFSYDCLTDILFVEYCLTKGSNPFAAVELASQNLALLSQLEKTIRSKDLILGYREIYADIALILKEDGDSYSPNDFVAMHLAKQVKHRTGKEPTPKNPAMISLRGLSLKEDSNSAYGLVFLLGDNTEVIHVPEFSHENNERRFSRTDKRGIPIFDDKGNRRFFSRECGLSRLQLDFNLCLRSDNFNLSESIASYGRVIVYV